MSTPINAPADRWFATYHGAALLRRSRGRRLSCSCAHGTCDRCLVARGVLAPGARRVERGERIADELDRAIDRCAEAADEQSAVVAKAEAQAALDALSALGVEP